MFAVYSKEDVILQDEMVFNVPNIKIVLRKVS